MMQITLALLALLVTPALVRGITYNSRLLLAAEDDVFDEGDTSEVGTVYQEASSTTGATYYVSSVGGWEVSNITGSIELDTAATYADNLVLNRPGTWEPGTSRVNVTVVLTQSGTGTPGAAPPTVSASLATVVCGTSNLATSLLANNNSGDTTATVATALGLNVTGSGDDISNSTIYNFLVDYDLAKSIVVYGDGVLMACKNMLPPFPDFPNDWSATIENTDVERGVTYTYEELYSTTFNMLRLDLHSYATDRIILSDPNNGQTTIIVPSNGSCQGRNFGGRGSNWITADDNTTLLSTAEMLHFTQADEVEYQPGFVSVRGIPCEVWVSYVDINIGRFNASFQANFYFPVNEWLVAREDYHRMLKRVYLNGTRNGEPFESYNEYVNFRPRTVYGAMFDVCAISPYGQGCNCTNALRAAAFANVTQALSAEGDDFSVPGDIAAACQYETSVPHGFISAQSGPYVGLTIIGMIGGSLITGICMYIYYRKRVGVRISDNLGHTKFTDAPGT